MVDKTISVSGRGVASAMPDNVKLNLWVESRNPMYDVAVKTLTLKSNALKEDIIELGFNEKDLKTTKYSVNTDIEYVNGSNQVVGYIAKEHFTINFPFDEIMLNKTLKKLSNSNSKAMFNVSFEVENERYLQNEAIKNAVKDAIENATILAKAANVALGEIVKINYGEEMYNIRSSSLILESGSMKSFQDTSFNPSDVDFQADVHIIFNLNEL